VLCFRRRQGTVEVLLVHPGGPLWVKKDAGAWTIPKGELGDGEDAEAAARREFEEETGARLPTDAPFLALTPIRQAGGKIVHAFAVEMDLDASAIRSNSFTMEWPPKSGRQAAFPEIDRAEWFGMEQATAKILAGQRALLQELSRKLAQVGGASA
jgi:predicted NUDIX family NTP pyrophosphohydrolase